MSDCFSIRERFFTPRPLAREDPEFAEHLAACEACRRAAAALEAADVALGPRAAAPVAVPPFAALARSATSAARARRRGRALRNALPFVATGLAAAAAAVVVAVIVSGHAKSAASPVVAPGAQLETTSSVRTARLDSGTRIRLDAGRVVRLPAPKGHERLALESGSVSLEVPRLPEGHAVSVATRDAEVLVHGTRFQVVREARSTTVSVAEGVVEVQPVGPGRPAAFVHAGESLTVGSPEAYREGLRGAAQSALDVGQYETAELHLTRWLATEPPNAERAEANALLAWSAAATGNRRRALEHYRLSLAALPVSEKPLWAENACSEMALLLEQEHPAAAPKAWAECLARFPDGVHAPLARARAAANREP